MYTFSLKWRINDVPITCYLMTHAYFIFYHSMTNLILRRLRRALVAWSPAALAAITALVVLVLAYVTAFMETFTISNFPYYSFENRQYAYTIGSAFYAIYFIVSFPMFLRIDEEPGSSRCDHLLGHSMLSQLTLRQQMALASRRNRFSCRSHARYDHAGRLEVGSSGNFRNRNPRAAVGSSRQQQCCAMK